MISLIRSLDRVGILSGLLIALLANTGPCMRYDSTTAYGRYGVHGKEDYMKKTGMSFWGAEFANH